MFPKESQTFKFRLLRIYYEFVQLRLESISEKHVRRCESRTGLFKLITRDAKSESVLGFISLGGGGKSWISYSCTRTQWENIKIRHKYTEAAVRTA